MLRPLAIVVSAAAVAVACGGDPGDSPGRGTGVSVSAQRPPGNAQAPAGNPQQPEGNPQSPPGNAQAPLPNPQQPGAPGGGSIPAQTPGPGAVVEQCRVSCQAIAGECGQGCQGVCRGLREILTACQAEVQAFFACFGEVGVSCDGDDVELPADVCVGRLLQAGQLSTGCLAAIPRDGE